MEQMTALEPGLTPSFARAAVGFFSSITVMTLAMVVLGSLSA